MQYIICHTHFFLLFYGEASTSSPSTPLRRIREVVRDLENSAQQSENIEVIEAAEQKLETRN